MRDRLADAAWTALQVPLTYLDQGRNLAWAALAGAEEMVNLRHYPRQDVVDLDARTRFYYHSHPIEGGQGEHGHFHLFHVGRQAHHHLGALSLNDRGQPLRWFSTNQWVTGERWLAPRVLHQRVHAFRCQTHGRMAPVARWLSAMVALYENDLVTLAYHRQERLNAMDRSERKRFAAQPDIHVLDSVPIFLQDRIQPFITSTNSGDPT
jgi:hypothetical protein